MMDNCDYEACFGNPLPPTEEHEMPSSSLMRGPDVIQQKQQDAPPVPHYDLDDDDAEASSNYMYGNDYALHEMPVYDTDDGMYHEVDLQHAEIRPTSSYADTQLILIANKPPVVDEQHDDEMPPKKSCLSSLCFRFL